MTPRKWAGVVIAAGAASSMLVLSLTGAATASTPAPQKVAVPQGLGTAALKGLSVFGDTPASTPETVSFVLDPVNLAGLKSSVAAGVPGGFLGVSQFAAKYGQSGANISALRSYLAGYGIKTTVYADDLNVNATGTAGQFDKALSVSQKQYQLPAVKPSNANGWVGHPAETIHAPSGSPLLPAKLASFVLAVLGLSNYPAFGTHAVKAPLPDLSSASATVQNFNHTPEDFASQYDLSPVSAKASGAGKTIGIVTLATLNPSDAEYFWNNTLGIKTKANRISLVNVDGGSGPVSDDLGSGETTLDVEQSGAIAPNANIVVYQAPNDDPGFSDAFYTAASQNVADSVSVSWGEAEDVIADSVNTGTEDPHYIAVFDDVFLEFAAQGQSAFAASGDAGAYDDSDELGTTDLNVDNPSDSPWITASGGTTLGGTQVHAAFSVTVPAERTWAWDYLFPFYAQEGVDTEADFATQIAVGGGGGFSQVEPTPAYQAQVKNESHFSAVQWFTPTDFVKADGLDLPTAWNFSATPAVVTGTGSGRATPDVSANADPETGYLLYFTEFDSGGALQGGWGGTSFVAPQFNGATVLIDSYLGHRIGFWNTAIYKFATGAGSPFHPLTTTSINNDNLYYSGTKGQLYNVGSGLGTPDFAKLAAHFR